MIITNWFVMSGLSTILAGGVALAAPPTPISAPSHHESLIEVHVPFGGEALPFDDRPQLVEVSVTSNDPQAEEWGRLNQEVFRLYNNGQYTEAARVAKEALAVAEAAFGPDHPSTLNSVNNLGALYDAQGLYEKAEPLYLRALAGRERVLGPDHPDTLQSVNNLGGLYDAQGLYEKAEPLLVRALAGRERVLGPGHPDTLSTLGNYTGLRAAAGAALSGAQDGPAIRLLTGLLPDYDQKLSGIEISPAGLANPVSTASRAAQILFSYERLRRVNATGSDDAGLRNAAFQLSQRFAVSDAAQALAASAARLSLSDDGLQALEKRREDLATQKTSFQGIIDQLKQSSTRDETQIGLIETQLSDVQQELDQVLDALGQDREGAALTEVTGVSVSNPSKLASLLVDDEALIFFTSAGYWQNNYLAFVLRPGEATAISLGASRSDVAEQVADVRAGLGLASTFDLAKGKIVPSEDPRDLPHFDQQAAKELYDTLMGPLLEELGGVKKLLIVADGPLQSLPFSLLVSDVGEDPDRFKAYGKAGYLVDDYAVVVYPSVSSLETLRAETPASNGSRPFLGFGDPVLKPDPNDPLAPPSPQSKVDPLAGKVVALGGSGDWTKIEDLPDIGVMSPMLTSIGTRLGALPQEILLRGFAREADLRYWNDERGMDNYKLIAFGTHALVSDELESLDLKEPAIVLSRPPHKPGQDYRPTNDGLFRASDVVGLNLDADMVILAACNTAGADGTPGAAPLSGLAKTFMVAGARSLLVSNWQADAASTATFIPDMVERAQTHGYAKALQQAKISLRNSADPQTKTSHYTHPAIWGTFTLIAEPRK